VKSQRFHLREQSIELRKKGNSIRYIELKLGIPKSTLSGWLKNITLSPKQLSNLNNQRLLSLITAREKAILWHNKQKANRIKESEKQALKILSNLEILNSSIQDLALSMLYLAEGSKTKSGTSLGSSDPQILKFFIKCLLKNHCIRIENIKCALHLRADQDPLIQKNFWSSGLKIPLSNFTASSVDLRTKGKPSYPNYNGVCVVSCGNIALQRKLIHLSKSFCKKIINVL